jgi:transcription antitermination factor NusG
MEIPFISARSHSEHSAIEPSFIDLRWYALYSCANHEKSVASQLQVRGFEHFLPLYSSLRRWKDRRVSLDLPLFPGYVFVRVALHERWHVLQTPGVVHLVGFGGKPCSLPETEIVGLRNGILSGLKVEPHARLSNGTRVRIERGPLKGVQGILVRNKNTCRVVLSLNLIGRSAAVEVDAADIEQHRE